MEEGATRGPCPKDLTTRVLSEIRSQHKFDTVDFSNDRGDPHLATDVVLKKLEPLVMVKYGPFLGSCCPLTSKSNSNLLPPPPIDHSSERIIGESTSSGPTLSSKIDQSVGRPTDRPTDRPTHRPTDNEINSTRYTLPLSPPPFPKFHTRFDVWNNYIEEEREGGERKREREREERKSRGIDTSWLATWRAKKRCTTDPRRQITRRQTWRAPRSWLRTTILSFQVRCARCRALAHSSDTIYVSSFDARTRHDEFICHTGIGQSRGQSLFFSSRPVSSPAPACVDLGQVLGSGRG